MTPRIKLKNRLDELKVHLPSPIMTQLIKYPLVLLTHDDFAQVMIVVASPATEGFLAVGVVE